MEELRQGCASLPGETAHREVAMLGEEQWEEVHRLFTVERWSKSAIARELDLDVKTAPWGRYGVLAWGHHAAAALSRPPQGSRPSGVPPSRAPRLAADRHAGRPAGHPVPVCEADDDSVGGGVEGDGAAAGHEDSEGGGRVRVDLDRHGGRGGHQTGFRPGVGLAEREAHWEAR